ncbi:MAG: aminotransferase class I/II-fold pyridoxal phosphate-dependent enzyme, partial [Burkholderiales bacterium]
MKPEYPPQSSLVARAAVRALSASKIRELYNEGLGKPNVLPFWVGEPDEPTPDFIRKAGTDSIAAGELFYTHNLGIPELRETLAAYAGRLRGKEIGFEQVAVTTAGVNALMVASQLLVDPGDRVVQVVPLWPNLQEIPKILGATVETVALEFSDRGWQLNLQRLLDALKPGTKALYLNSPNNPTGWTVCAEELKALLAHCRRHGIWIFADDAYERLYYGDEGIAPSFLGISEADDRLISANTFSKSWLMTGWRLGWLVVPAGLTADLGKLIEYNTSCAPVFVQRAGIAAVK